MRAYFFRSLLGVLSLFFFFNGSLLSLSFAAGEPVLSFHPSEVPSSVGFHSEFEREITKVAVSKEGEFLISASRDGTTRVWSLSTQKAIRTIKTEEVTAFAYSEENQRAAISSRPSDLMIKIFDLRSGKELLQRQGDSANLDLSPDGKKAVSSFRLSSVDVWDSETGELLQRLDVGDRIIRSVKFLTNDQILSTQYSPPETGYNVPAGLEDTSYLEITSCHSKPDGWTKSLTAQIWDIKTGKVLQTFVPNQGHWSTRIAAISPSRSQAVFLSLGKSKGEVWNLQTGTLKFSFSSPSDHAAFSKDETLLALTKTYEISIWDLRFPNPVAIQSFDTFEIPDVIFPYITSVNSIAFSPDGKFIFTGLTDGKIKVFQLKNKDEALKAVKP